jgi:hypothetical protein
MITAQKCTCIIQKTFITFTHFSITVSLSDLLGGDSATLSAVPAWLLSILGLISFGLICVILVIVCMRQQMFCFGGKSFK